MDEDGFGDTRSPLESCEAVPGFVEVAGDCDDLDDQSSPSLVEVCGDLRDNDCDGTARGCEPESRALDAADALFSGEVSDDEAGTSVAITDFDADGFADLAIGALGNDAAGPGSGAVYLVPGGPNVRGSALADAAKLEGPSGSLAGSGLADAGDVDGDGCGDLLVVAYVEAVYLVLGAASLPSGPLDAQVRLTASDSDGTLRLSGAGGGDPDGDGLADLLVGAVPATGDSPGAAWLVPGSEVLQGGSVEQLGTRFLGEAAGDGAGASVAGAGDVDGDARDDLLVGAPSHGAGGPAAGAAYLVSDAQVGGSLADATVVWVGDESDYAGVVAAAGDVNSDGYRDVLVGAPGNDDAGEQAGAAWLVLGEAAPNSGSLTAVGVRFTGVDPLDFAGEVLAPAGDVDADGHADFLVGSETAGGRGAVYLVLGSALPAPASLDGAIVFSGSTMGDRAGAAAMGGADLDGDGYDDVVVGAPGALAAAGVVGLIFGWGL